MLAAISEGHDMMMMSREYSDDDDDDDGDAVRVVWETPDFMNMSHNYGKIIGGRYDGAILRQDGYHMLLLSGGSWVKFVETDPTIPSSRDKNAHKAAIEQAVTDLHKRVEVVLNLAVEEEEEE